MVDQAADKASVNPPMPWRVYRNDTHQLVGVFVATSAQGARALAVEWMGPVAITTAMLAVGPERDALSAIVDPPVV